MKTKLTLNGSPPRIETHGKAIAMILTDTTGSTVEIEMDMSVGYQLEQGLLEIRTDYGNPKVHPVFAGILRNIEGKGTGK